MWGGGAPAKWEGVPFAVLTKLRWKTVWKLKKNPPYGRGVGWGGEERAPGPPGSVTGLTDSEDQIIESRKHKKMTSYCYLLHEFLHKT